MKEKIKPFSSINEGEPTHAYRVNRGRLLLLFLLTILSLTACTPQAAPQATPTLQPPSTHTLTPSNTPTPTSTFEPTLAPSSTPLTGGTLNEEGPWLMYQHADGTFYFVNPDGTGRTKSAISIDNNIQRFYSSSGNFLTIKTQEYDHDRWKSYLSIYKLPELDLLQRIDLFSYFSEHEISGDEEWMTGGGETLWSPDSRYLAFTAVIDGPSFDLYVYDTITNLIKRLSWGEQQAGLIAWSPDSKEIIHDEQFAGAGSYTYNLWATAADGSGNIWLYTPEYHGLQRLISWLDNYRFITTGLKNGGCGDIRVTNLYNHQSTLLYEGTIALSELVIDYEHEVISFVTNADGTLPYDANGIYLVSINAPYLKFITNEYYLDFNGSYDEQQGYFITNGTCKNENGEDGRIGYKYDGVLTCFQPTTPTPTPNIKGQPSPNQEWILAYQTNELCTFPEGECVYTYGDGNSYAMWRPDSKGFFVFREDTFFYIPTGTLTPILIDDQSISSEMKFGGTSPQWIGK